MVYTTCSKGHLIQFLFKTATQILKQQFVRVLQYNTTQCGFEHYVESAFTILGL